MFIIDVSNPLTLILLLAAAVLLIFLGKEIKKPIAPALALAFFLVLVVIHSIQFGTLTEVTTDLYKSTLLKCLAIDAVMIFITFFGYLWIDDVAAKFYKKKSIDSSLDWFWGKI